MKCLRIVLLYLNYTNCWVACCNAILVFGVLSHYQIEQKASYSILCFFATLSAYSYQRWSKGVISSKKGMLSEHSHWLNSHRKLLLILFTTSGVSAGILFFSLQFSIQEILPILVAFIIVIAYVLPFPNHRKGLRNIPVLKSFFIVAVWIITVYFPVWVKFHTIDWTGVLLLSIMLFTQIIPFDCRDITIDFQHMRTLPQLMGINNAKRFAAFLILLTSSFSVIYVGFNAFILLYMLIAGLGLWLPTTSKNQLVLEFLWDGAILVYGLFLI